MLTCYERYANMGGCFVSPKRPPTLLRLLMGGMQMQRRKTERSAKALRTEASRGDARTQRLAE